jgi:hypothetical protein
MLQSSNPNTTAGNLEFLPCCVKCTSVSQTILNTDHKSALDSLDIQFLEYISYFFCKIVRINVFKK